MNLLLSRLIISLRSGDDIADRVISMLRDGKLDLDEIEYYQDFEKLYEEIIIQVSKRLQEKRGIIYLASYGSTGYHKVGKTTTSIKNREKQLNNEATLEELNIIASFQVFDCSLVEAELHKHLKTKFPKKKEFFLGNFDELFEIIKTKIYEIERRVLDPLEKIGLDVEHLRCALAG